MLLDFKCCNQNYLTYKEVWNRLWQSSFKHEQNNVFLNHFLNIKSSKLQLSPLNKKLKYEPNCWFSKSKRNDVANCWFTVTDKQEEKPTKGSVFHGPDLACHHGDSARLLPEHGAWRLKIEKGENKNISPQVHPEEWMDLDHPTRPGLEERFVASRTQDLALGGLSLWKRRHPEHLHHQLVF